MTSSAIERAESHGIEIFRLAGSDDACAQVVPEWGNNCFAFQVFGQPVLEPVSFDRILQKPTSYGIPILFPFPNRIRDGRFVFRGTPFVVSPNRHGFVRDLPWKVVDFGASAEDGAWIRSAIEATDYRDEILSQFPFPFRLETSFRLRNQSLEMETMARNVGEHDMPLGFGIHPYFARPERGTLLAPARKLWELVDSIPTGRLIDMDHDRDLRRPRDLTNFIADDLYTNLESGTGGMVRCQLDDTTKRIRAMIEFGGADFPTVVVYTPPEPRKAVCIEPYTCPTDGFNLFERNVDSNVIVLPPHESIGFQIRIHVSRLRAEVL